MLDKKGIAYIVYFWPSIILLAMILLFFIILFFIVGIQQSPNLVIKAEAYEDSSELNAIIRSTTEVKINNLNLSIGQLVSLAHKDQSYKEELSNELNKLLNQLAKLPEQRGSNIVGISESERRKLKEATWNLDIKIEENNFLHIGEGDPYSGIYNGYLIQIINIPLEEGKLAEVVLYLNCFDCTNKERAYVAMRRV